MFKLYNYTSYFFINAAITFYTIIRAPVKNEQVLTNQLQLNYVESLLGSNWANDTSNEVLTWYNREFFSWKKKESCIKVVSGKKKK